MVRKARNGIVYPYRVERRKRLSDGTVKIYASYEFKVDGKTYSRKKYVDANKRLTELLQERARFGSANNSSITLGALWDSVTSYHARPNRRRVANVARCPAWNCPGPSEWLTIASPSKGVRHGVEGFENETRNDATRVGRENRRDTTAYSGLRDRRAPVERNESRCCDTYLRRAQGA